MKWRVVVIAGFSLVLLAPAHAISAKYRKQLEHSGCTQMSEQQGCDIHKSRAENEKAGFAVTPIAASSDSTAAKVSPYSGKWIATMDGKTIAKIQIDEKEKVRVNNILVKVKRSAGGLVFKSKSITYRIQGDRRLADEDVWNDFGAKTSGPIKAE